MKGDRTTHLSPGQPKRSTKTTVDRFVGRLLLRSILLLITLATLLDLYEWRYGKLNIFEPRSALEKPVPLAMEGGDPYIRALMRTISASESNVPRPYSVIYGGSHFSGWNHHPDECIHIPIGPNTGNCSTAAGRYQFITTTWEDQAKKYHPEQPKVLFWRPYRFDPTSQDVVVHRWLSNPDEWGVDLAALLRQGQVEQVLEILSPTWTSLGYGIETNSMSAYLPEIYAEMLDEEIALLRPAADPTAVQPAMVGQPLTTQAEAWDSAGVSDSPEGSSENGDSENGEAIAEQGEDGTAMDDPYGHSPTLLAGWAEIKAGSEKLLRGLLGR